MSANVYYKPVNCDTSTTTVQEITRQLLDELIEKEDIILERKIPLKVHFGEEKNKTYIKSENFEGIIDYLKGRDIEACYMETCVLYGGQRYKKELHIETAKRHGFTQLPIVFADGDHGEDFAEVVINKNHLKTMKIGRAFLDYPQHIVISHFKGHMMAGFGGAMKQLSMGYASKGGKLAMHCEEKPHIVKRKCKQCNICKTRCQVDALNIGKKSWIDHSKCLGCGACTAVCPHKAISIFSLNSILKAFGVGNPFIEKMAEGAYAAQKDRNNIYFNFAMNITPGCDCEARKMKTIMDDFGVFISTDPVAIDKACYDIAVEKGKKFRGHKIFPYAEKIGLGTTDYNLVKIN